MSAPAVLAERAAEHVQLGGISVAAHFGDPAREYRAAREGLALACRADRALFRVAGTERGKFLQGLLTNDVASLQPGAGSQALFLDNKGHVRGVLDVWAREEAIIVGCEQRFIDEVLPDLARYVLAADVQIADLREEESVLAVVGAGIDEPLGRAGIRKLPQGPLGCADAELGGVAVRLARTPDLGVAGIEVHVPAAHIDAVWEALEGVGGDGQPPCLGLIAAETLRIEAGVPRIGHEITGEEFPQELLLDALVDYEKGCYLGQETVARIHYRGQVNRLLGGVRSATPLSPGAELISSERAIGRVTSAAQSPRLGSVALALVRREEAESGASVEVRAADDTLAEARLVTLPIGG
jgi:folate-binding protein YgfZ